jgi:ribonuclease R
MARRRESRSGPRVVRVAPAARAAPEAFRKGHRVLGLFVARDRAGWVEPFDPAAPGRVAVPGAFRHAAEAGDAVEVEVLRASADGALAEGRVLEVLGAMRRPGTDVEVAARRHSLAREFPSGALEEAARLPGGIPAEERGRRTLFDDPAPVTIDGETAKDFDDAVAVAPISGGGTRLWVHIADVSHFVRPGGALDWAARERATSVYFPGRVIPMLPERLSNDLCSLVPGRERLVQSAIVDFDAEGRVRGVRFADGIIRSDARLTYTEAAEMISGKTPRGTAGARIAAMLRAADRLRETLEAARRKRGSVDLDLPEPKILLDVEGAVTGVAVEERNPAHRLVESFMLAANEAVAARLARAGVPCLFRVHDPPDPAKVDALASFASNLGLRLPQGPDGKVTSRAIQRLLDDAEGRPEQTLLAQVALRSMMQARYDPAVSPHFGLAAKTYTHFTSPIRRYPDLIVHRSLRAFRIRRGADLEALGAGLAELAAWCSTREREAEAAEREVLEWRKVAWLAGREGDRFEGIVTAVAPFGLFVRLNEALVDGLVRVERLGGDWFDHLPEKQELRGRGTGRSYRLGDTLEVTLTRVDTALRRIDLVPAGDERVSKGIRDERPRPPRGRRRRR